MRRSTRACSRISRAAGLAVALALVLAAPARAELEFLGAFGAPGDGELAMPIDVALDGAGNTYVADLFLGKVKKLDPAGNPLTAWGSAPGPGQLTTAVAVGVGPDGTVYVADVGLFEQPPSSRIVRFDPAGNFLGEWGQFGTAEGQLGFVRGISVDSSGAVFVLDSSNHRVQRFDANGAFQLMWGKGVNGGAAAETCTVGCQAGEPGTAEGEFDLPGDVTAVPGTVVVSDTDNNRVQRFDSDGAFELMAGRNVGGAGNDTCIANCQAGVSGSALGEFERPGGVAILPGEVQVADSGNSRVQRLPLLTLEAQDQYGAPGSGDGQFVALRGLDARDGTVATTDTEAPRVQLFSAAGAFQTGFGAPGQSSLLGPAGVAAGPGGVYVSDAPRHRVARFGPDGDFRDAFGSQGAAPGQFQLPAGAAIGPSGEVFVADRLNNRIQRFDPQGNALGAWGSAGAAPGELQSPHDVATDAAGNVYVADRGNDRVQKFTPIGGFLGTWGAPGNAPGQLDSPEGIAVGPDGDVLVADSGNDRIQRFGPDGELRGGWGSPGSGDGELSDPGGIAVDAFGNVYVADSRNNRIQRFDLEGSFLGKWGANGGDGSMGRGPGQFVLPGAIAVAASGELYVADRLNLRVQRFAAALGPPGGAPAPPELVLRAAKRQRHSRLVARVRCNAAPCNAVVRGQAVITMPRKGAKTRSAAKRRNVTRKFALQQRRIQLGADSPRKVRLKFKRHKRTVRRISRLLKRPGRVRARAAIRARAFNDAGADRAQRRVKLKRPRSRR